MSSYRRYYLPSVSWSDVKGGVWRIQPYNVTDYFFIFRVQNLLTSATRLLPGRFRLRDFPGFTTFPPTCFLLSSFRLGDFPTFPPTRLLPGRFRLRDFPGFTTFPPTRLLPNSFRLGDFSDFSTFPPSYHSNQRKKAADFHRLPKTLTSTKIRLFL